VATTPTPWRYSQRRHHPPRHQRQRHHLDRGHVANQSGELSLNGPGNGASGDTLDYTGTATSVSVNLGGGTATGCGIIAGIENVIGGSGADSLTGDSGNNRLDGGAAGDTRWSAVSATTPMSSTMSVTW
jgi:hemolysin type calcium-binding protein